ncbi:MAG: family 16 glycosylhydrolase [Bacteroidota bacterium]
MRSVLVMIFLASLFVYAKPYKGAEYRTKETYTYGRFEVRMKAAQREGMLSSFFTYHEITTTAEWNEIDIEILGRYTDDVQFNTITPGQVNHVSHYKTSFNPSLEFHTYAFEWTPTYVAWFVDGKEVYRQTGVHIESLNRPQKIMMNIWNPTYPNWVGEWNENVLPAFAYYDWVSYSSYTPGVGNTGTDSNFTFQWKDDFDVWDQTRWEKATHTWAGNGCDFVQANAVLKGGTLILCLTKETALGYTDGTAPTIAYARAENDGIVVMYTEEVDSATAVNPANYLITGKQVSSVQLLSHQKGVKLTLSDYDMNAVGTVAVMNVKDRFTPANAISVKSIAVTTATPLHFPVKINCGGPEYKDYYSDQQWSPLVEYGHTDGATYTNSAVVSGTLDPGVYNSELNGAVKYLVRVPNGTYTVILMMSENYFSQSGKRIFTVFMQDSLVESNLDLYAKVGKSKVYQKVVQNVRVVENILSIHFMAVVENPLINGIQIFSMPSGINDHRRSSPQTWYIGQNYPNPFNGSTIIPMESSLPDNITIRFYDMLGRKVSELPVGFVEAGKHSFRWNAIDNSEKPLASGVYWYVVEGQFQKSVRKLVVIQ